MGLLSPVAGPAGAKVAGPVKAQVAGYVKAQDAGPVEAPSAGLVKANTVTGELDEAKIAEPADRGPGSWPC